MIFRYPAIASICAVLGIGPAFAETPLTYAMFEEAVGHIDLETCPGTYAAQDVFCRATLNNDGLHVFVFETSGDQPLVAVESAYEDDIGKLFD